MVKVSQNTKYVKLDDGVSFSLVRTNPKLTTNTKLMYNGKKMYMESYASCELLNRTEYKNVSVKQNSTYNKDIASFLIGTGSQAYNVHQNFSDITISDSYDNQFETLYWCGAEYIDSYFYDEEIGFVAPLYLREKLPNYFVIFRLDTPSNYNLNIDGNTKTAKDSIFDFKSDILDKAVLIKSFDLREGSVLGDYIHNYINQDGFEFDKSMYVNFSNAEVTYYGINKNNGVLEKRVESFENELLRNDNPVLKDDEWFTEGFERNGLIFPYIMNIEYLFDDDAFKHNGEESYDFARYIGVYCNSIEFEEIEFDKTNGISQFLDKLKVTEDNAIYYFEDNKNVLHRYVKKIGDNAEYEITIDGKDANDFDIKLISGFEKDTMTGYAEPVDIYEGFINRAQYGFEILKPFEPGDWVGIEYNGNVECYFADDKNINKSDNGISKYDMKIGEYKDFRFSVKEGSSLNDIATALVNVVNRNKGSKFEAKCTDNAVAFYAKREGKEYNGSDEGGARMLLEASLIYNKKISLPISKHIKLVSENNYPVENISNTDSVVPAVEFNESGNIIGYAQSSFGNYYKDYFCGACDADINFKADTYKNVFKIYADEYILFDVNRYLKTNNGDGRRICANMTYVNSDGKVDPEYRIVIVDNAPDGKTGAGYDVSVSSTYQVEIMDPFTPNSGILSWFPVKDFDFDINYSSYGQYNAFAEECYALSKKVVYTVNDDNTGDGENDSPAYLSGFDNSLETEIQKLAKSAFYDDDGVRLESEYDYYLEQYHPDLCLLSKTTPYISKWGYYDEQKDSCENPYRLNVNKVFGVSNLSANIYLKKCDESEYTHSMPYYMTMHTPDYLKDYQYIESDELYAIHSNVNDVEEYAMSEDSGSAFDTFTDCVNYWLNIFKNTDKDWFSHFFSGKKYGKRFDRKYSRLLGGDKLHNPSTLFRGVKFEAIRQYSGVEKRTNEYNNYKFSFVYIPVMVKTMSFNSTVYFVKNDTFKFIVGIVFVNTMLGEHQHNIFGGDTNYFNKGFLYAACKDIIKAQGSENYNYSLKITYKDIINHDSIGTIATDNIFWRDKVNQTFYMWQVKGGNTIFVTSTREVAGIKNEDVIGEFDIQNSYYDGSDSDSDYSDFDSDFDNPNSDSDSDYPNSDSDSNHHNSNLNSNYHNSNLNSYLKTFNMVNDGFEQYIDNITNLNRNITFIDKTKGENELGLYWNQYVKDYDVVIYGYGDFEYVGDIYCGLSGYMLNFENNVLVDICDIEWKYFNEKRQSGYIVDVSKLYFKSESLQNILINLKNPKSVVSVRFYNVDSGYDVGNDEFNCINEIFTNEETIVNGEIIEKNAKIEVDTEVGCIIIKSLDEDREGITFIIPGYNGEVIENLRVDIVIRDEFNDNSESLALKNYFSVFEQISVHNISEYVNNDYNVKYYSTVEDNKYKIRVIEPDSIETKDIYEVVPVKVTQNNKSVDGSVEIREKYDVDKIGIKAINRYSGFYNPIFNDVLYYGDYTYTNTILNEDIKFELPYSNTHIDYEYNDGYGEFGVIKNMYYHKTNTTRSNSILTSEKPVYPAINEYALDYRDYNIFSSSWDNGYFISQDDLTNRSYCNGIGSMKDGLCMFGSKYLNLPDYIFIDTFENGKLWDETIVLGSRDNVDAEILYKEINDRTVEYHLYLEKRLKRYLVERLTGIFSKYINKEYSFGDKSTINDDVEEYVDKNLLKLYKVDKVYMYVKEEMMRSHNRKIENEYLRYMNIINEEKINLGFPVVSVGDGMMMKESAFSMSKTNEFDRNIVYNLKSGYKESFGFGVSFKRK